MSDEQQKTAGQPTPAELQELTKMIQTAKNTLADVLQRTQTAKNIFRNQVEPETREAEARLKDLREQCAAERIRVQMLHSLQEAEMQAATIVSKARREAREIVDQAGADSRKIEAELQASIQEKSALLASLQKGIAEAHEIIRTSIATHGAPPGGKK